MTCRVTLPNREIDKRRSSFDLHSAARSNRAEAIRALIECRTHCVDERDSSGATALIWAANYAAVDAVEELLRQGADPNASDNEGVTPVTATLKAWILGNHEELETIVIALIEAGADPVAALKSAQEYAEEDLESAIQLALIRRAGKIRSRARVIAYTPPRQQFDPPWNTFLGAVLGNCFFCFSLLIVGCVYLIIVFGLLSAVFAR